MNKSTKFRLCCSVCERNTGKKKCFTRETRTQALNAIRDHLWKNHREWMIRRIKRGRKKSTKVSGYASNPGWATSLLAGIFPPATIPAVISQWKSFSPAEKVAASVALKTASKAYPAISGLVDAILMALAALTGTDLLTDST